MGDCLWAGKPSRDVTNRLCQLSLPSLRGRYIEYRPIWLGLRRGAFTSVGCVIPYDKWRSVALRWVRSLRAIFGPLTFNTRGCIFHLYGKQKSLGGLSPNFFLVVGVHNVITPFKFGDDRFRGFGLTAFSRRLWRSSLQHSHYRVRRDVWRYHRCRVQTVAWTLLSRVFKTFSCIIIIVWVAYYC